MWHCIHAWNKSGSQSRKWTEFLISHVAYFLAGNSSCPLVYPCYWWETGDPSTLTAPIFEDDQVVCKQVKNEYAVLHHLNLMVPKSFVYFSTPQMWLHMEAFGRGRTYLGWWGGGFPTFFAVRHDIMAGWRQAGRGYGWISNEPIYRTFLAAVFKQQWACGEWVHTEEDVRRTKMSTGKKGRHT